MSCIAAAGTLLLIVPPGATPVRAATAAPASLAARVGTSASAGTVDAFGLGTAAVCGTATPGHVRCLADVSTRLGRVRSNTVTAGPLAGSYSPSDLTSAYGLASASRGTGHRVAVVVAFDDPSAEADLGVYRSQFSLAPCTTATGCFRKVDQSGGTAYPAPDAGWATEASLDLDMVSATCPLCSILLVEASSTRLSDIYLAIAEAHALGATEVSLSLGAAEYATEPQDDALFNHPGVATVAATGDSGYGGGVQYPAASPFVTAAGGTKLTRSTSPSGWSETAWSGAGSGCSAYEAKPAWQTDGGCARRTVADVSATADATNGVAVYDSYLQSGSGWMMMGGTSASAPIVAGSFALNGQGATPPGGSSLYQSRAAVGDVVSGSTGVCTPAYLCTAQPGYDGPTGMGSIRGAPFAILSSSANPSTAGGSVAFTARVTPAAATGTVTFSDGATPLGTVTLSSGAATYTISALVVGAHSVTASYSGDATNAPGSSSPLYQGVNPVSGTPTATSLTSPANPSTSGQPATLTATVTPASATGTVTFTDGPATLGTATLSSGAATLSTSVLGVGTHTITALYGADASNSGSSSPPLTQTVNSAVRAATSTAVTPSVSVSNGGVPVTFTAAVTPAAAAGTVTFSDGPTPLGSVALSSGVATLTTSTLAVATHTITAAYGGDLYRAASVSPSLSQTVLPALVAPATTALRSSSNPSVSQQPVTLTATFTGLLGLVAPTGTVAFTEGATTLGTATLGNGSATWVTPSLSAGVHSITARYRGDLVYTGATSPVLSQTAISLDNQHFVANVYRDLLGRPSDPGGLAYWSGLIDRGQPRFPVAINLTSSTEYRGLQVQALYRKYLQRPTDGTTSSGGEGFWVGYIAAGATFEQLAESLIGSDEYFHTRGHDDNGTYVTALYNDILGRGPEGQGLAYWVGRLSGGAPHFLVSASILDSTESHQNLVRGVFQTLLGHQPDPSGLDYWTGRTLAGLRDELLTASIIATDEYFGRP